MNALWWSVVMVLIGILLLRASGRRSISQMTFASLLVMLSLGTVFATPLGRQNPVITLLTTGVMLATLVVLEWLQLKFRWLELLISGRVRNIVEDGRINERELRKLRLSESKLEMRLRQKGITNISDIQTATIEVNGELGYILKPDARPLTVREFHQTMQALFGQMVGTGVASKETEEFLPSELTTNADSSLHPNRLQ